MQPLHLPTNAHGAEFNEKDILSKKNTKLIQHQKSDYQG